MPTPLCRCRHVPLLCLLSLLWTNLVACSMPPFGPEAVLGSQGSLDCSMRTFAYTFLAGRQSRELYDALQLQHCSVPLPLVSPSVRAQFTAVDTGTFDIDTIANTAAGADLGGGDNMKESRSVIPCENVVYVSTPQQSIHEALERSREYTHRGAACARMELGAGIHYLNRTLVLDHRDSGLTITGQGARKTWLSGGVLLRSSREELRKSDTNPDLRIHLLRVPAEVVEVTGLFGISPHRRFQRARWPNGDTERVQWGYASPQARIVSNPISTVEEWIKRPVLPAPSFHFVDLRRANPTGFVKDDSTQQEYNMYTSGKGGVCDDMWDTSYSSSYWCGNASSGGWAEVDQRFAKTGTVGLPRAMRYATGVVSTRAKAWKSISKNPAVIHVWHSQSWFTNMFEVVAHSIPNRTLHFGRGGSQGGRSWCQCDQCTYAAKSWCLPTSQKDARLISGNWYIENVAEELDAAGEFYFNASTRKIHLLLNATSKESQFIVPVLETLVRVHSGAKDIQIRQVGFRDAKLTYLHKHGVPSGGDWSLYKGAAVMLANVSNITVVDCSFVRLDGTAILLHDKTRAVSIERSEFEWLGESAIALWGRTDEWDGRSGLQPRGTKIHGNVVREIGIYQKQSSAVFQAKACNSTIVENLFYNMPRAAINFNDGFGGGNVVKGNLIFNSCRESGDHGAINSWDRQPFLYDRSSGFSPKLTHITHNLIFANYGASQGVDNDDGSSYYNISSNVFYSADGFKMDYGGHDSMFVGNLVVTLPYDGANCFILGDFKAGHQHAFRKNKCVIIDCRGACSEIVGFSASCKKPVAPLLMQNEYYTKGCNATIKCGQRAIPLDLAQKSFPGLEAGSSKSCLPTTEQIMRWAHETLQQKQLPRISGNYTGRVSALE